MRRIIGYMLTGIIIATCWTQKAQATDAPTDSIIIYDQTHPLVYEDAWDLWPYVFLNENGEPDGYNIDLLKMIMKELDIPYIVKLKATNEARKDLQEGRADLQCGMDAAFTKPYAQHGNAIIHLFTHSVVMPKTMKANIRTPQDLKDYTVSVHTGSLSHHMIEDNHWARNIIGYSDMKEAIQKISASNEGLLIWNTMSLKWLMRKYHTDNLTLVPIELPYGEYKFMANDRHLLAQVDSIHERLKGQGRLQPLQNKWFYPENTETGIPSWIWNLIALLFALSVIALLYYAYYHIIERRMTKEVRKKNERLALILKTSGVNFWTYNVLNPSFTIMDNHGRPTRSFSPLEFSRYFSADEFERLHQAINKITKQEKKTIKLDIKALVAEDEERDFVIALSVLRQDRDGRPTVIMCTQNDVTDLHLRKQQTKDMMLRYQSIFNSAMMDMMSYDGNGQLNDLNKVASKRLDLSPEKAAEMKISLDSVTGIPGFSDTPFERYYATEYLRPDDSRNNIGQKQDGLRFYEMQLVPIFNNEGKRIAIYGTGRDVTEVAESYRQQKENLKQLKEANTKVARYINDIDYVLTTGGVRMARYNLNTHQVTVYRESNNPIYTLTQTRALSLISEKSKRAAQRLLNSMDNGATTSLQADIQTTIRLKEGYPLWLQVNFIPINDEQGQLKEYFGMFRDISKLMAVETELEKETNRAQEVEKVKNSFLRNMSFEIRTPLNTVVGFAELFESEHAPEDEVVFSNEIKENSSKLLKLINDILFLSRLDADMIEIKPKPVDFALIFESRCHTAWANDQKPGVEYLVQSPYEHLMVEIDDLNLTIVLEKIINNATQHTESGTVLARYDYIGEQLMVSIEDTGEGIPEHAVDHLFERFVTGANSGAGLGLSICSELIHHMGGTINLKSTEGKGTTVWFSIPCKATEIIRK